MGWREFTAAMFDALAWPLAVVAIGFLFRRKVAELLAREGLERFKAGPGGLELVWRETVIQAEVLSGSEPGPLELPAKSAEPLDEDLRTPLVEGRLTRELGRYASPEAVIVLGWATIEGAMADYVLARGGGTRLSYTASELMAVLHNSQSLSEEALDALGILYRMNQMLTAQGTAGLTVERNAGDVFLRLGDRVLAELDQPAPDQPGQ